MPSVRRRSAVSARRATGAFRPSLPHSLAGVSRVAGGHTGTMGNWHPRMVSRYEEPRERRAVQDRAQDLCRNDGHAAGLIGGIQHNVVGTGIMPQSRIDFEALGISENEAQRVSLQAERAFKLWCLQADAGERMPFQLLQSFAERAMLQFGEHLFLCPAKKTGSRDFSFCLQAIDPRRMMTPAERVMDVGVSDGVRLGPYGEELGCYIAQPDPITGAIPWSSLANQSFYYPKWRAHRPVYLHGFIVDDPEQVRGVSILAPAMKFFRDLSDYLDFELVGQIISASYPVAIRSNDPRQLQGNPRMRDTDKRFYDEIEPGQVLYLNTGEEIVVLDSKRPGNSFDPFVERILRASGAAANMPYEVVARDFSKTNYSSARAALLEAWRVFQVRQQWLIATLCRPCWEAVFEEAYLRGFITLPAGAPDFYACRRLWTAQSWLPPRRGHVDPVKEINAEVTALLNGISTYGEIIESRGQDVEDVFRRQARERAMREALDLPLPEGNMSGGDGSEEENEKEKEGPPAALHSLFQMFQEK